MNYCRVSDEFTELSNVLMMGWVVLERINLLEKEQLEAEAANSSKQRGRR